jgi:DNA-directed RNA polymerase specialized sigma subunit
MTPKEYLSQAYRLNQKIDSDIEEVGRLRQMEASISSLGYGERVQTSRSCEAPFVRSTEKIVLLEQKINEEIDLYVDLKQQIRSVISEIEDPNEQMVLRYRYVHNMTWEQIGDKLFSDRTTASRWHERALRHVKLPDHPIVI